MARDLSVQAILTANTTPFANGMKQAAKSAKQFSADMKKVRQELNQPLYVPRPGGKQETSMVMMNGSVAEAMNAQIARAHRNRFEIIRNSEERALRMRQFYARKEAQLEQQRAMQWAPWMRAGKKAMGGASVGALAGLLGGGDASSPVSAGASILGGAAAGGMMGGAPGAAVGGTIAALIELQQELKRTANAAKEFSQAVLKKGQEFTRTENQKILDSLSPFRETQKQLYGRDAAPGDETPFLGGIFGMTGGGRFQREKLFTRGLAQAAATQAKIEQELSPEFTNAAISRLTAELVEEERVKRGGKLTSNFGFTDDTQAVTDEARIEATRRVTARNERLLRDSKHISGEQASLQSRRWRERSVAIGVDFLSNLDAGSGLGAVVPGPLGRFAPLLNRDSAMAIPNMLHDPAMRAAQQAAVLFEKTRQHMAENDDIASRVMSLRNKEVFSLSGTTSQQGSNQYLQDVHGQPKSLAELVKIAKEELAEQKKLATQIGVEVNRQRITVKM
jgi:hypothetical protein